MENNEISKGIFGDKGSKAFNHYACIYTINIPCMQEIRPYTIMLAFLYPCANFTTAQIYTSFVFLIILALKSLS